MLSFIVFVICAATAANGFHMHRHHFTIDMNGFHHDGNHHRGFGFHHRGQFGPPPPVYGPPPPVYGPPPFTPNFHHGHHQHTPQCNHKPEEGFGMIPLSTNTMSISNTLENTNTNMNTNININTNTMPFKPNTVPNIPNIMPFLNIPFNLGQNFPFNSPNPFHNPNQIGGSTLSNTEQNGIGFNSINNPSNLPIDPLPTYPSIYNTMTPLDANTAFDGQSSSTSNTLDVNGANQPQNPTSPTQSKGLPEATKPFDANQNTGNNYNATGAIPTNNELDINNQTNVPNVDEPTTTPAQGKFNGLDFDIDVRFSDDKSDNRTNQKSTDTIQA